MRFIRIVLSIVGLTVLVSLFAIVSIIIFVDPNTLKPVIIKEVKNQTGYQITIDGRLEWSFYPRLGVKVAHMTVAAPQQSIPFADLRNAKIATDFWQLLQGNKKIHGDVYISDLIINKLHVRNTRIHVNWHNEVLTFNPITASLYDGSLKGRVEGMQLSSALPKWNGDVQFSHIQLNPLLTDLNGANSKIKLSGLGEINLQAQTLGKTLQQILTNLNGKTEFKISNGTVEGIDLNYLVESADALINKEPLKIPENFNQTVFNHLVGTALIKNGIVRTNNLTIVSSALLTKGQGDINLGLQSIDLELKITTQKNIKTQWEVPVSITGQLTRPDVRLDPHELQKLLAKKEIDRVKTKVKDEIQKRIPQVGEFLQNLISR